MKKILFSFVIVSVLGSMIFPLFLTTAQAQGRGNGAAEMYTRTDSCPPDYVASQIAGKCVPKFTPLVGIPFIDTAPSDMKLADYVNALYLASISIAAFMAVVKIIFAGVKYMLSDVVTTKEDAKKDIRGALIGLLIVVGAVLILNTINPKLTGLGALDDIQGVHIKNKIHTNTATGLVTGPKKCPDPINQILNLRTTDTGIERFCTERGREDTTIPTQDDVREGYILQQKILTWECGGVASCDFTNSPGNLMAADSAEAECEKKSNGEGQFDITGIGSGVCTWEIPAP